jgi:uncharacterized protein involved in exopolysaccharide biosynthesis
MGTELVTHGGPLLSGPHASALPLREMIAAAFRDRRRVLLAMFLTFAAVTALAAFTVPSYTAQSTLLVLLSKDYAAQSEVGSERDVAGMLDRDAFLKAETDIIESEPLAREVVRQIGVARLYPQMLNPSFLHRLRADWTRRLGAALGLPASPSPALEDLATVAFSQHLSAVADKAGNVITVSFRHPDAKVAAEAVNDLVAAYLAKRIGLYAEIESTFLGRQASDLSAQLEDATRRSAGFKAKHGIIDYPTQRDILLHQQADLVRDQQNAASRVAQLEQRLSVIDTDIARTPPELTVYSESDTQQRQENLRSSLENLKVSAAKLRQTYLPNYPMMAQVEAQIRDATAQLATTGAVTAVVRRGRNTVYDDLVLDRAHADQDLQAARAQYQQDTDHLAVLGASLTALEGNAVELADLDRQVALTEIDYRSVERTLESRRIVEAADANTSNVRVISPAIPPLSRPHLGAAILVGGALLSLIAGILTAFLCDAFRRGFLLPEKLERNLGLPVLAVIPEFADFGAIPSFLRKSADARFD